MWIMHKVLKRIKYFAMIAQCLQEDWAVCEELCWFVNLYRNVIIQIRLMRTVCLRPTCTRLVHFHITRAQPGPAGSKHD